MYKGILASDIAIRREGTQHTFFSGYVLSKMLSRLTLPVECVGFIGFETQTLVQESYKEARCAHFCGFVSLKLLDSISGPTVVLEERGRVSPIFVNLCHQSSWIAFWDPHLFWRRRVMWRRAASISINFSLCRVIITLDSSQLCRAVEMPVCQGCIFFVLLVYSYL